MSQSEKAHYYRELQAAGVNFDKHYREYNTAELKQAYDELVRRTAAEVGPTEDDLPLFELPPEPVEQVRTDEQGRVPPAMQQPQPTAGQQPPTAGQQPPAPAIPRNEDEMPGQRLNSQSLDEPIRVDENGLIWYQEEVRKPAYPRPRGRRVLKYMETGVVEETVKNGEYVETFEVAGTQAERPAEVKITLPSYQVGIYKDRRFPFKIHVYAEQRGFDLFEVQNYYGGSELVPAEIKRIYVENVLCYDIRTTVRAIQTEYRQLQLAGKV